MIAALPTELTLDVLSYLDLSTIANISVTSHKWHGFLETHQATIYRASAAVHGFIAPDQTLELCQKEEWLKDAQSWKDICKRYMRLNRAWRRQTNRPPRVLHFKSPASGSSYRIKVDEGEQTLITTSDQGGLLVRSITDQTTLWSLPQDRVPEWAHLEWSNGFAIFSRHENEFEVWVRSADVPSVSRTFGISPDPYQVVTSQVAGVLQNGLFLRQPLIRGAYTPYTVLRNPSPIRAYRFVYPHLLVASRTDMSVQIWDIPSKTLVETFTLGKGLESVTDEPEAGEEFDDDGLSSINYVELSPRHVIVCFGSKLVVYRRSTRHASSLNPCFSSESSSPIPDGEPVFDVPNDFFLSTSPSPSALHSPQSSISSLSSSPSSSSSTYPVYSFPVNAGRPLAIAEPIKGDPSHWNIRTSRMRVNPLLNNVPYTLGFTAAHCAVMGSHRSTSNGRVSEVDVDMVGVTDTGLLFYVRGLDDCIADLRRSKGSEEAKSEPSGEPTDSASARRKRVHGMWVLKWSKSIHNLTFDGERIVFNDREGIYNIVVDDLDRLPSTFDPESISFPASKISLVYMLPSYLSDVTCLQSTTTSVWFAGNTRWRFWHDPNASDKPAVVCIDFSKDQEDGAQSD